MPQIIQCVDAHSPAQRAGLRPGDEILSIGGQPVIDFIDYQVLTCEPRVEIRYRRNGAEHTLRIRKEEYADLGLDFGRPMMSGMRMCCNRCLFCFVDQLPENVRPTMRVKDDDWRMSMMMGNYVTLTNVSDREIDRIIARRASPLYISVHATDPKLRAHILGTPRAARLMDQLRRLSDGGIEFHTQAVLCPDLNDGAALDQTIRDLIALPGAQSLAIVPVGLTGHRAGLHPLSTYTKEQARKVIRQSDAWRARLLSERGTRFVFPSDEFYLAADVPLPADAEYEGYEQIDDGVGLLRQLETEFHEEWIALPERDRRRGGEIDLLIACGVSAAPFLQKLMDDHPITGIHVRVLPVRNRFFGESVTVSGLITGRDLADRLINESGARIFITECMLRSEGDKFLDDMTLADAEAILKRRITPVGRHGWDLVNALISARKELEEDKHG